MRRCSAVAFLCYALLLLVWVTPMRAATITHLTYGSHGKEWLQFLKERAEVFKKLEPDITIDFMVAAGDYTTRFIVMEAGGAPPDVTDFYPSLAGDLITKGYFLNLAPLVEKTMGQKPEYFFAPATLDAVSSNGQLWSLPIYINPRVTYYNIDHFLNMGVVNPSQLGSNWNWSALRNSARKLAKDKNGDGVNDIFGIENMAYYLGWQQLVHQAGGQLYDRVVAPTGSRFLTDAVQTAVEFARQLMVEDRVVGGSLTKGTAALVMNNGPGHMAGLTPAFGWDIELQPLGPVSRAAAFGIGGFQVTKNSKEQDAAFKWVRFLTLERESVSQYVKSTGRIPPLRSAQPDYVRLVPDLPRNWSAFSRTVEAANSFTLYVVTKKSTEVNDAVNQTLKKVWSGEVPARVALQSIHDQVTALLKD